MSTTLEIKQQQLDEVRAAISAVLNRGQSYLISDGGAQRQVTRANLARLQELEKGLEREVARLTNGGIAVSHGLLS